MALNYDQVKRNYFDLVELNIDLLKGPMCTRQVIEEQIIQTTIDPEQAKNFKVEIVDGQNKLFIRRNPRAFSQTTAPPRQYLEVLSVEDAFEVLLETHVSSDHGDAPTTYDKVSKTYSVPIFCAGWIVESCNVCNVQDVESQNPETQSDEMELNKGRGLWRLNIIKEKSLVLKSRVSFLLILKEDTTNFVVLRPIYETGEELCLDLMKLFTEFGNPEKVCVPNNITFYKKIFHLVHLINPAMNVPVEQVSVLNHVFESDKKEVLKEIKNWTEMMQDDYWEQSCHIVQYKLNTTEKKFTRLYNDPTDAEFVGIPYNQFFNYQFRTKMTWVTPPFLKNKPDPKTSKLTK